MPYILLMSHCEFHKVLMMWRRYFSEAHFKHTENWGFYRKVCQTAWKIFQFLQKERSSFSSNNCQIIDLINTYRLNGLEKPVLKVEKVVSRFTDRNVTPLFYGMARLDMTMNEEKVASFSSHYKGLQSRS